MIICVPELSIVLETGLLICFVFLAQRFSILLPTQFSFLLSEMPSTHSMVIFLISSLGYFITVALTVSPGDSQVSLSKLMNSGWLLHLKKKMLFIYLCQVLVVACGIQFPNRIEPRPLHWEQGVLAAGPSLHF